MSVRRSMAWSLLGNWGNFATSLISGAILARLLSPAEFGVFTVAMATVSIIQALLSMGPGSVLIREPTIDNALLGSAFSVALIEGLAISVLIGAASWFVPEWQHSEATRLILLMLVPIPVLTAVENVLIALWSREMQFGRAASLITAKSLIQAATSIVLARLGFGAVSLAAGSLAAAALGFSVAAIRMLDQHVSPNFIHVRRFLTFGGKWMFLGALRAANARIPELMLGKLVGFASTGLYNRASSSLDMVIRNGVEPIARVMLPVLAQHSRDGASMGMGVIQLSGNLTAIFWPAFGVLALESHAVVHVLFGEQWSSVAPVLSLLCIWAALLLPTSGTGEVLLVLDRMGLSLLIETVRTIIGIALVVSASRFGLEAVAGVRIVEPLLFMPVYAAVLKRLVGMSIWHWLSAHAQSLLITAITLSPIVFRQNVRLSSGALLIDALVDGAIALVFFTISLILLRHPLATEAMQIIRRRVIRVNS